eukprot:CAMPEP_0185368518 /NCGR_PEP_ID=MMETSP1364-20130426/15059_1 /TAXON_ID=38817 /ORGANISM="Gephyrocapsa oceanica, Strain RCC1303" /LENGTH=86 /DNA_ID=CAMNT_0027969201 /DNA_START=287 /DNA_END=544 /DNA_ORIENTATION=+
MCSSGLSEWPFGSGYPSTASAKRTTRFSGAISAHFTDTIALRIASATSLRTAGLLRHALGSHVTCTKGMPQVPGADHWVGGCTLSD